MRRPHRPRTITALNTTAPGVFLTVASTTASTEPMGSVGFSITRIVGDQLILRWVDLRQIHAALTLFGFDVTCVGANAGHDTAYWFRGKQATDELDFGSRRTIAATEFPQQVQLTMIGSESADGVALITVSIGGLPATVRAMDLVSALAELGVIVVGEFAAA